MWRVYVMCDFAATSERNHAFDHHALEHATVADVGGREVAIELTDVLGLHLERRGDEPAAAQLRALDRDVVREASQPPVRRVVAGRQVELSLEEARDGVAR